MKLIESDGRTTSALCLLTQSLGFVGHLDPREMNVQLQIGWVKAKGGVFRAQLGGRFPTEEEMVLLRQLGADAIPIDFSVEYAGTLLLGATLKAVTRRFKFLRDADSVHRIPNPVYLLGGFRSANTTETVECWLGYHPKPGRYLIVSSQPFCESQLMAVERAVGDAMRGTGGEGTFTFDVCGPAAPTLPLSRWLDNLAKQLWEEVQLLPK